MRERQRVEGEQAFVLHSYPFRETSLLVEIISRRYGRVALLAKGARRPRSVLRGALLAFQPLLVGWAGKGDVRTLMKAEWRGGQPLLGGEALFCGFYLNELLLRLLPREDAHDALFDAYADARWNQPRHFVAGDRAVSEWTFTGTTRAGARVEVNGCDLFTLRGGRIAVKNSYRKQRG